VAALKAVEAELLSSSSENRLVVDWVCGAPLWVRGEPLWGRGEPLWGRGEPLWLEELILTSNTAELF
jgi:hypothetical protein